MSQSRTRYTLRLAFVAGALSPVLVGLLDALLGLRLAGPTVTGTGEITAYLFAVMGPGVITGACVATGAVLVTGLDHIGAARIRGVDIGLGTLSAALGLVVFLEWANLTLFEGASVSDKWYRPVAEWSLRLAIPVGVVLLVRVLAPALSEASQGRATRRHRFTGAFWLVVSAGLCLANATSYRGLYPDIHLQEVIVAIGAATVGIVLLSAGSAADPARTPRRTAVLTILVAGILAGAIATRGTDGYRRARAAAVARATALAHHGAWGQEVLDWIRPVEEPRTVDVSGLIATIRRETPAALLEQLDRQLPRRRGMNILWLSIDTLRSDRCGFNGYDGGTTPRLDEIAKDAFVFTRAHSAYPTSNYSYSSALTSLYPRTTPVYKHKRGLDHEFPSDITLPGLLGANGWHTVGVTAFNRRTMSDPLWFGTFPHGFDVFNPDQQADAAEAPEVTRSALRMIRERPDKPYFLWAHYLEPHAPYLSQKGFDRGATELQRYDSEITYCDAQVGALLDTLKREGHLDDTIIVFFSDHGEAFGEHVVRFHNSSVYQTQIHVPLFIRIPGLKGRVIDTAVNLVDLLPTLVELVGVDDRRHRFGRSLLPMILDADDRSIGFSYSELFGWLSGRHARDQRALVYGRHKIVLRPYQRTSEIYDLVADPNERNSLVGRDDDLEARLHSLINEVDAEIDGYFGPRVDAGDERSRYLADLEQAVSDLESGADATHAGACGRLSGMLVTPAAYLTPDAERHLGRDGAERYLDRVVAAYPGVRAPANQLIIRFLGLWGSKRYVPFLKGQVAGAPTAERILLAQALAFSGDDTGRLDLQRQRDQLSGIALAYLGDPAGLPWLRANLRETEAAAIACHALRCIGNYKDLSLARQVRDRFGPFMASYEMRLALVEGLEQCTDPDATLLLLRNAQTEEVDVRVRALEVLRKRMSDADIQRNSEAMAAENAADIAVRNRNYNLAISQYRRALRIGSLYNSHARLRLARIEAVVARHDAARRILEDVATNSDVPPDRAVARRRIDQLESPFRVDPETLKVGIDAPRVELLSSLQRGLPILLRVPVKNLSPHPWTGGRWRAGIALHLRFEDANGKLVAGRSVPNWLPAQGINAGEEQTLVLLGHAPLGGVAGGRLVLIMKQDGVVLPDDGVVYRHPVPFDL